MLVQLSLILMLVSGVLPLLDFIICKVHGFIFGKSREFAFTTVLVTKITGWEVRDSGWLEEFSHFTKDCEDVMPVPVLWVLMIGFFFAVAILSAIGYATGHGWAGGVIYLITAGVFLLKHLVAKYQADNMSDLIEKMKGADSDS